MKVCFGITIMTIIVTGYGMSLRKTDNICYDI